MTNYFICSCCFGPQPLETSIWHSDRGQRSSCVFSLFAIPQIVSLIQQAVFQRHKWRAKKSLSRKMKQRHQGGGRAELETRGPGYENRLGRGYTMFSPWRHVGTITSLFEPSVCDMTHTNLTCHHRSPLIGCLLEQVCHYLLVEVSNSSLTPTSEGPVSPCTNLRALCVYMMIRHHT